MPGPGGKKNGAKKKHPKTNTANELSVSKSSEALSLVSESYVEEIGNAEGWNRTVDILCDYFNIPDLNSRSGLRRVHSNFDAIWRRLDGAYTKYERNERILIGIVGIYAKMCADAILRDKLFQRGFLSKIRGSLWLFRPLYRDIQTYPCAVPVLVKLSDTQQDNQSDVALLKTLDMARVIKEVTLQIKKPFASKFLIEHGARMLSLSAETCSEAMFANPSSVHFLVAGLRSTEWENRTTCLNGVLRLFRMKAETDTRNLDLRTFFQHARQRLPDHLMDILGDYGLLRSETIIMKTTESQFQRAIMSVLQDRDLHKLGLILADLIVQTEFSIPDGAFEEEDPRTGKRQKATFDTGLPFKTFREALPQCARVFRQRAAPGELDKADILDIKYLIMQANIRAAAEVGSKGLLRNPNMAYFQYAQSLLADPAVVLRSAKKGLKCKQTSPFIQFQLLQRAVENAGQLGLQTLEQASSAEDPKWEEGVAFFMSAWTDSNTFLAEAPPDNRHMRNVLYWNILLAIIIRGPELNPNLEEIKSSLKKLSESDDFTRAFSQPIPNTQLRLAQAAIVEQYSAAVSEWEEVILRLNNSSEKQPEVLPDSEKVQNDLNNFLNDLQLDDESPAKRVAAHPKCYVEEMFRLFSNEIL
ncbi:set and mynd domain-containing protein 3 [Lentinula edodes]|uniref:Set and mynd domain-containing protein 3 n=1 Tax=Lentinula edodes TaxID=5353 RepID=A0A1Q3E6S4_LENED|nr:set and mynd domain-containing protein 3 [Lentinula edodes]